MTERLSERTLAALAPEVERPRYDRQAIETGVVHLGLGAFHRAHQALVFEAALAGGDRRWGVLGASLRSAGVHDQLAPQDGLYTVAVRDGAGERLHLVGALKGVLVAPRDPAALLAAMAAPTTHLVTLTVTEKGYHLDPATGALDTGHPDVAADIADPSRPRTAPGFLAAALGHRRAAGLAPFTTLSCDNLPHNGRRLAAAVLAIAEAQDPALARWIEAEAAFPATMVDRIVPATTDEDIAVLAARIGLEDRAMVKTEPFCQWVIEDRFCGPRPDFAALGVTLVTDVAPWEAAKLRLLNGAHSAIAYLGGLAGFTFVHEFVAWAPGRRFVEALWDEAVTTVPATPGMNLADYRTALMARFANPALGHRTRQIAMDGSQKLPQRLLAPIAARLDQGAGIAALALAVAAWMRWQGARDDAGTCITVDDPLAGAIATRIAGADTPAAQVQALLAIEAIFPPHLARDQRLRDALVGSLERLSTMGAAATLSHFPCS